MTAATLRTGAREQGGRRVQRIPSTWPVVHLEDRLPPVSTGIVLDGLVSTPRVVTRDELVALPVESASVPMHCVWGWSKPDAVWDGVRLAPVLELAGPEADFVVVHSASGTYSSCLPLDDARRGLLAWGRAGQPLPRQAGGPLRFVAPPQYWGYKSVKWAARITVVEGFQPGFWESKVADPVGRIPDGLEVQ